METVQTLSSHSSTPEFKRNVTPNGSTFLQNVRTDRDILENIEVRLYHIENILNNPTFKKETNTSEQLEETQEKNLFIKWVQSMRRQKQQDPKLYYKQLFKPTGDNIVDHSTYMDAEGYDDYHEIPECHYKYLGINQDIIQQIYEWRSLYDNEENWINGEPEPPIFLQRVKYL